MRRATTVWIAPDHAEETSPRRASRETSGARWDLDVLDDDDLALAELLSSRGDATLGLCPDCGCLVVTVHAWDGEPWSPEHGRRSSVSIPWTRLSR